MAPPDFPNGTFRFFPRGSLWSGGKDPGGGNPPPPTVCSHFNTSLPPPPAKETTSTEHVWDKLIKIKYHTIGPISWPFFIATVWTRWKGYATMPGQPQSRLALLLVLLRIRPLLQPKAVQRLWVVLPPGVRIPIHHLPGINCHRLAQKSIAEVPSSTFGALCERQLLPQVGLP